MHESQISDFYINSIKTRLANLEQNLSELKERLQIESRLSKVEEQSKDLNNMLYQERHLGTKSTKLRSAIVKTK